MIQMRDAMMNTAFIQNITKNYPDYRINGIEKFGHTTINDIFLTDDHSKIIKLYNVTDDMSMSALGQFLCSSAGISPKVFRNAEGQYVSAYLDRTYSLQEYIAPDKT